MALHWPRSLALLVVSLSLRPTYRHRQSSMLSSLSTCRLTGSELAVRLDDMQPAIIQRMNSSLMQKRFFWAEFCSHMLLTRICTRARVIASEL